MIIKNRDRRYHYQKKIVIRFEKGIITQTRLMVYAWTIIRVKIWLFRDNKET